VSREVEDSTSLSSIRRAYPPAGRGLHQSDRRILATTLKRSPSGFTTAISPSAR
jgi:hypothetical protein